MTKTEVLNFIMAIHPHEHEEGVMRHWLEELEAKICCELHHASSRAPGAAESDRLSVPAPYDKVYWTYLNAMLDLTAGNSEAYALSDKIYREAYAEYAKYLQRSHGRMRRPKW